MTVPAKKSTAKKATAKKATAKKATAKKATAKKATAKKATAKKATAKKATAKKATAKKATAKKATAKKASQEGHCSSFVSARKNAFASGRDAIQSRTHPGRARPVGRSHRHRLTSGRFPASPGRSSGSHPW